MIIIYKGYLKSKGKRTVETFKDTPENLVKYNTARRYDSFVGVLADDYIMLDIDTHEESDILMDIIEDLKEKVKKNHIKEPVDCKEFLIESIKRQMDVGEAAYEFEHQKSVVLVISVSLRILK